LNSSKPVVLYYDVLQFHPENLEQLHASFDVVTLPDPRRDSPDVLAQVDAAFAPLGFRFGPEKIDQASRLKVIGSNTTGHAHIDVAYAEQRGVRVVTLEGQRQFLAGITPTAEMAFGLIIALTRNLLPASAAARRGEWSRWPWAGPAMLSRMSLGVAGFGRLGRLVARYGRAFGMSVRFYDPRIDLADDPAERVVSLAELVQDRDVISVHLPHEPETDHVFDRALFARFKPGAFLVNTARGELIDQAALLEALRSGRLAGAALDVLDGEFDPGFEERLPHDEVLAYARTHDNLVLTPHVGGSTRDAWKLTQAHTIRLMADTLGA
jgi:phosphoglycerate dehydrogenase-like enzyme